MKPSQSKISIEDMAIQNITLTNFSKVLKTLDSKYSEVIVLRYYFGYTDSKLAKHFNVSPEVIRKRCERGKKMLIKKLNLIRGESSERI